MPACRVLYRVVLTVRSEFAEGLRSYRVGLEGLRYLCSIPIMHWAPGFMPCGGRSGVVGLGTSHRWWDRSACVLLMGQGCENLPEGTQGERLDFGVTANQALASPPNIQNHPPGPAVPGGDGRA